MSIYPYSCCKLCLNSQGGPLAKLGARAEVLPGLPDRRGLGDVCGLLDVGLLLRLRDQPQRELQPRHQRGRRHAGSARKLYQVRATHTQKM